MEYSSQGKTNQGRQPEIDCLKAFCILPMILLHAYEECAEASAGFFYVLRFIESISGAGTFMLCMGLLIRYSRKQSPRDLAVRGLELLTVSQLLNLLRDSIPDLIAWWCTGKKLFLSASLLVFQTDILTFAGLALLLMALLRRLKLPDGMICGLSLCMNAGAFALSFVFRTTGHFLLDQILGLFVVTDAESYFPLCSYFFFVAFGMALGGKYREMQDKDGFFNRILKFCLPAVVLYSLLRICVPLPLLPGFFSTERYVMMPVTDALVNSLSALCLLALFDRLLRFRDGRLPALVAHLSRHINQYYCISYVLLTPMGTLLMALRGKLIPGSVLPLLYGLFVLAATYFLIEWNEKHLHFGITGLRNPGRRIVIAAIWLLSAVIILYAYPQVQEYATVWNDYLM